MIIPSAELTSDQVGVDPSDTLRLPRVRQRTGLGRSTIYRLMSEGKFPGAVQLSPRAVGWHKSDIDAWLNARPKASQ
jgi:prophage regulatory protein